MKLLNILNGEAVSQDPFCGVLFLRGAPGDKKSCGQIIWGLCRPLIGLLKVLRIPLKPLERILI